MYQSEANELWENAEAIPADVRKRWGKLSESVTARSLLPWGEHCTECAVPHCYTSCDLYQPRKFDQSCRRFTEGMVCVTGVEGISPWLLKIQFKQWGKLWAIGTTGLFPLPRANWVERLNYCLGTAVRLLPVPKRGKRFLAYRYRQYRINWARKRVSAELPDYFLVEAFNPGPSSVALTLRIVAQTEKYETPFLARFMIPHGLQRTCFPIGPIYATVDLSENFYVELSCSESDARPLLYFGCVDFVRDRSFVPAKKPGACKCVVWDLDNTVWDGVLVEDGPDRLTLKPGIREIFAELDRRGILLSVASKNNPDDVMPVLKRFGLAEYILKPEISWEPKGRSVRQIAQRLNIGLESLLFVDDSPFERAEVKSVCPEVTVIDAVDANWLLWREECLVSKTGENERRRSLYRDQEQREEALKQADGNYEAFLRDCNIKVNVLPVDEKLLPRVHELVQRTNQMNFSGTRHTREQIEILCADKNMEAMAIEVEDRFGNYGIVGFALMDRARNILMDLAFSCRIQSKQIEHAFLAHLLTRYPARPFRARWKKTERNAPAGKVFADLGFRESGEVEGVTELEFSGADIPRFDFISLKCG